MQKESVIMSNNTIEKILRDNEKAMEEWQKMYEKIMNEKK